ncbi:MAG: universal stress protein [Deltaproteobacteria bacterium]|nr:universal stress protein [Deltaproteobacteria bacterium]
MTTSENKRGILVALDGSDYSFETVRYIRNIPSFKQKQIVLFTVFTGIPSRYRDLQQEAVFRSRMTEIRAWEGQRRRESEAYMADARQKLLDAGSSEQSVEIRVHEMEKGIARDIIAEAGKGYTALMVGKRGVNRVTGLTLGSVATKLIQKVSFLPLFLVGRDVRPGKVLIAFDGSEGCMRAVDCVGVMLKDSGYEINLANVVRHREDEIGFIADAEHVISAAFDEAIERLTAAGIPHSHISTQIITGAISRAETIVREAAQGGYGTIVVGRRGLSRINEFFMGRVSNKIIQLARGHAVWVVS